MKIILPAGEIPIGSRVTKRTGTSTFKLIDMVQIYSDIKGEPSKKIRADEGVRFLIGVNGGGDINAISDKTELCWITSRDELLDFLEEYDG